MKPSEVLVLDQVRRDRITSSLNNADAALAANGLTEAAQGYDDAARLAGDEGDYRGRGAALMGAAQVCRVRDQQASAAVLFADAAVCLLAVGDALAAASALAAVRELAVDAQALVVHRALAFARSLAHSAHAEAFERAGDEVLCLLKGAAAESVIDAALSLCTQALSVGRAGLCSRWLVAAAGALRALAARGPEPRISRAADLLSRALGMAHVGPSLASAPGVEDGRDLWAFALADLGTELGDRALDELRRLRAHLVRARLLVEAGRAADALPSAKAAFALARSALGDDDPVTNEALALRTAALLAAPVARA